MFLTKKQASPLVMLDRSLLALTDSKHPDDRFSIRDLCEHLFVCGSTGTGKTSTIGYYLASQLLNRKKLSDFEKPGLIVFLYKSGDLDFWIRLAEEQGRKNDLMYQDMDLFNLLEPYDEQEAINAVDVLMVLAGLGMHGNSQHSKEQYWEQMNRQRLHRLILLNQLSGEKLNVATLFKLHSTAPQMPDQLQQQDFLNHSYCMQMLGQAQQRVGGDDPQFRLVESYFTWEMPHMADRTQSSILSMTSGILEPFISSPLLNRLFCGKTTRSLNEMLRGRVVILNLPIQEYEYSAKVAQIMLKHMLQKQIEKRDLKIIPNPVCLWLDEYQHFISPYDFLFMSTARSSRAGCVLMTQNISNLFAQIGGQGKIAEEKVNALLALTNHKIFLAQNNHVTNHFASRTIGQHIRQMVNSSAQIHGFSTNSGISEAFHPQVMPREFTMLARGGKANDGLVEAIVTATGKTFSNGRNYLKVSFRQPWTR